MNRAIFDLQRFALSNYNKILAKNFIGNREFRGKTFLIS